jgi:hypothetical protein
MTGPEEQPEIEETDPQEEDPQAAPSPPSDPIPPGCGIYFSWLGLTILGSLLGWWLGWQLSYLVPGGLSTWTLAGVMGLVLGAAQWPVVQAHLPRSGWWVLATGLGWMAGFQLGSLLAYRFGLAGIAFGLLVGVVTGAVLGLFQWVYLQRWVSRAGWWVPASIFAWASSLIYFRPGPNALGGLMGALVGLVTGLALLWLVYRPADE